MSMNTTFAPYSQLPVPLPRTSSPNLNANFTVGNGGLPSFAPYAQTAVSNSTPPASTTSAPKATYFKGPGQGALQGVALSSALFSSLYLSIISLFAMSGYKDISLKGLTKELVKISVAGAIPGAVIGGIVGSFRSFKEKSAEPAT